MPWPAAWGRRSKLYGIRLVCFVGACGAMAILIRYVTSISSRSDSIGNVMFTTGVWVAGLAMTTGGFLMLRIARPRLGCPARYLQVPEGGIRLRADPLLSRVIPILFFGAGVAMACGAILRIIDGDLAVGLWPFWIALGVGSAYCAIGAAVVKEQALTINSTGLVVGRDSIRWDEMESVEPVVENLIPAIRISTGRDGSTGTILILPVRYRCDGVQMLELLRRIAFDSDERERFLRRPYLLG